MSLTSLYPQAGYRSGTPLNTYPQQFPGMQLNMPLSMFQPQQPNNELIGLHGLDSAKQYPMKPNTTVPTFDMDSDHAFIISADVNGVPSIKILKFEVVTEEEYRKAVEADAPVQLQKSEYDELKSRMAKVEEELKNAKQLIQEWNDNDPGAKRAPTKSASEPSIGYIDPAL